jgi:hypothetical protein
MNNPRMPVRIPAISNQMDLSVGALTTTPERNDECAPGIRRIEQVKNVADCPRMDAPAVQSAFNDDCRSGAAR